MSKRKVIRAVHDKELKEFMESIGLFYDFVEGKLLCYICGKVITVNNLGAFFPYEGDIKVVCNDVDCYNKVLELRRGEN